MTQPRKPESIMKSNGCPRIVVQGSLIKSGMTISTFNCQVNIKQTVKDFSPACGGIEMTGVVAQVIQRHMV